jgi:hypothetical protein
MDLDWLADWLPMIRTCGVLLVWTSIVIVLAMGIEAVLRRH